MALALSRHLATLQFTGPTGGFFPFSQVFDEWPTFGDKFIPPAACVTPTPWRYDEARMVPRLLTETWEPSVEDVLTGFRTGTAGFGLYVTADIDASWDVTIRCVNAAQREAVIQGMETSFVPLDGDLFRNISRYGVLLPLPEYYGMQARFALQGARVVDDEERAMRNHREAVLTFTGQTRQVVVGPVRPLNITIRQLDC
jgi:hypothetical protein